MSRVTLHEGRGVDRSSVDFRLVPLLGYLYAVSFIDLIPPLSELAFLLFWLLSSSYDHLILHLRVIRDSLFDALRFRL